MKLTPPLKGMRLTPSLKGALILFFGLAWFFAVFIPQPAILAIMNTDPLTALYLSLEHGVLDACFVIAAFYFLSAGLMRKAVPADLGLVQWPFLDEQEARRGKRWASAMLYLATSLALVIVGLFVLLVVQGQWQMLLQNVFHLIAPANDWTLPDLLAHKPISFGVEVIVLCIVAPFSEEVLFRGVLFQWLAGRIGLWPGILLSAFIFTAIHWSLFGFANTLLLGIFAALLLRVSRSIWPGIVMHALWNVIFVFSTIGLLR